MSRLETVALLSSSIGSIGSFVLVILAWINSNARVSDMNAKFDSKLSDLTTDFKSDMHRQFDEVSRQFGEVNRRLTLIKTDLKQFYGITQKLEGRVDEISRR